MASSRLADESRTRFEFGANWSAFLSTIDRSHIERAKQSLRQFLKLDSLQGKSFLDVGSGSGLFSLAAYELGAKVHSFDFDPQSVACTREMKRRFAQSRDEVTSWNIEQGSILDEAFLSQLGTFDIVYSWGVLHHTGALWPACANASKLVGSDGLLFIAIYNDQGFASGCWKGVKWTYNVLPRALRFAVLWPAFVRLWGPTMIKDAMRGRPLQTWRTYADDSRGMNPWHDVVDWVGGYPFEVATPQEVIDFFTQRGFQLVQMKDRGRGRGCNEFLLKR
jgi:2-polyprenyl-6-hydroxyphenyl methylase/3-demethylubiquinone-9 3-methyltransferase